MYLIYVGGVEKVARATLREARAEAWRQAREMALTHGIDPDTLGWYDHRAKGGARGITTEGDEGGVNWPIVERRETTHDIRKEVRSCR